MRLEAEEHEHPPAVEIPQPQEPDEFGNFQWQLDASIYKQRKKWADARGYHETDLTLNPNPNPNPDPNPNPNPNPNPKPKPNLNQVPRDGPLTQRRLPSRLVALLPGTLLD